MDSILTYIVTFGFAVFSAYAFFALVFSIVMAIKTATNERPELPFELMLSIAFYLIIMSIDFVSFFALSMMVKNDAIEPQGYLRKFIPMLIMFAILRFVMFVLNIINYDCMVPAFKNLRFLIPEYVLWAFSWANMIYYQLILVTFIAVTTFNGFCYL
jgi:hypothetical protein